MRIGAKKRPFYRVVAVDERAKRTGGYIELLGTYNPLTTPHEIILKQDKIDEWIKNSYCIQYVEILLLGEFQALGELDVWLINELQKINLRNNVCFSFSINACLV